MNLCKSIRNEKGLGILSLLLLMPILLFLISHFFHRWAELQDSKNLRAICRQELGEGLATAGQQIESLLGMNKIIRGLKVERVAAHAAVLAASLTTNALLIQAARWHLRAVNQALKVAAKKQRYHLTRANLALRMSGVEARSSLYSQKNPSQLTNRDVTWLRGNWPKAAVRKKRPYTDYPEYELMPNFERRMRVELRWQSKFEVDRKESAWSKHKSSLPESCGMTLRPKVKGFEVLPVQDKYFWRR